jgi:hypothetical protein
MHVASALGVPTIAVFGATDDVTTGPTGSNAVVVREHAECSPCLLRECPIDHRCMTRVTAGRVIEAAEKLCTDAISNDTESLYAVVRASFTQAREPVIASDARSADADGRTRMDISRGFRIEQPEIFVPWGASEAELQQLFVGLPLRLVTQGYFTISCTSLGGCSHELGFHFYPRGAGTLNELEFFRARSSYPGLAASYEEFQQHLEAAFGTPTATTPGSEGYPSQVWRLKGAEVLHFVRDRFGPEEHVRIKRGAA